MGSILIWIRELWTGCCGYCETQIVGGGCGGHKSKVVSGVVVSGCERKILWVLVVVNRFGFIFGVDSCGRLISLKFLGLMLVWMVVIS